MTKVLSKGHHFAISPREIDCSGYLTECELLDRSTRDLSLKSKDREHFKAKLKEIAL